MPILGLKQNEQNNSQLEQAWYFVNFRAGQGVLPKTPGGLLLAQKVVL